MARVEITQGEDGLRTVLVDGKDITEAVYDLTLDMGVLHRELPTVSIDINVLSVGIKVEDAQIYLPDGTQEALVALGWTPPGGTLETD